MIIKREPLNVDVTSLTPVKDLGGGSFGSVFLEKDPNSNSKYYAKKSSSSKHCVLMEKELRIMLRYLGHPRIIQPLSPFVHRVINSDKCHIYMEYASKGTLRTMISDYSEKSEPVPEYLIQRAVRMILEGLEALHSQGYVHGDLKPSNVLLFPSTTPGEPWDLKLADFGSSKEPNSSDVSMSRGTPQYMSPESFLENGRQIDSSSDIYSLKCMVYDMHGGKAYQEFLEETYDWILRREIPQVSQNFLSLCDGMPTTAAKHILSRCGFLPTVRATAAELLNHPFITQNLITSPR